MRNLKFFASRPHACGYFPDRVAAEACLDPAVVPGATLYGRLLAHGFRRSGAMLYRPWCPGCADCVPLRLPVGRFRPDRSQRRCLRRNADLEVRIASAFRDEYFTLYRDYLDARHPQGEMAAEASPECCHAFLEAPWCETLFAEFHSGSELVGVAVTDVAENALSAVYTFFSPEYPERGLGTHAILWQVAEAQRRGLEHLYLGFRIEGCPAMAYKSRFRPAEMLANDIWVPVE